MSAVRELSVSQRGLETEMRVFLCQRYWLPDTDYPNCNDVFGALGIAGSDCHDFTELYAETFGVDMADFIWPKYHLSESEAQDVRSVLRPVMRMAGLKTKPLNRDLIPISIDHLLQVAQAGAWFDPMPGVVRSDETRGISRTLTRFSARLRAGGVPKTPPR